MVEVRTHGAKCPMRPGDPCSLWVPGASVHRTVAWSVYLVMSDPDLLEPLHQIRTASV
jgi:hypothetical protein